jgi:hypothetical protein
VAPGGQLNPKIGYSYLELRENAKTEKTVEKTHGFDTLVILIVNNLIMSISE